MNLFNSNVSLSITSLPDTSRRRVSGWRVMLQTSVAMIVTRQALCHKQAGLPDLSRRLESDTHGDTHVTRRCFLLNNASLSLVFSLANK